MARWLCRRAGGDPDEVGFYTPTNNPPGVPFYPWHRYREAAKATLEKAAELLKSE